MHSEARLIATNRDKKNKRRKNMQEIPTAQNWEDNLGLKNKDRALLVTKNLPNVPQDSNSGYGQAGQPRLSLSTGPYFHPGN